MINSRKNNGQTVLLTGAAGYVGSILTARLLSAGYRVRAVDFLMFGGESLLGFYGNDCFELINGDLRDLQLIKRSLDGVDAVVHLAALVGEEACNYNSKITTEINYNVTKNLADLCKKLGTKRFVFASTCSNYGTQPAGLTTEETKLNATSTYAETKIAAEKYLLSQRADDFHPCIYRLAMKFGLSPKMRFNLIVNDFSREAVLKNQVTVYGPESWRAFTHVSDAAQAYLLALEAPLEKISGQIFNVATENFQKQTLIGLIKKHMPKVATEIVEGKIDLRNYRVSIDKIKKWLGFEPTKTVEEGFLEIKSALENGLFTDPYDKRYEVWYNERTLLKWQQ